MNCKMKKWLEVKYHCNPFWDSVVWPGDFGHLAEIERGTRSPGWYREGNSVAWLV